MESLTKARICLVATITLHGISLFLPDATLAAIHIFVAAAGLVTAAFMGGFYMEDVITESIAHLLKANLDSADFDDLIAKLDKD